MSEFALHLVVDDVPSSITFYEQALNAQVTRVLHLPDGSIATAELDIDGLPVALAAPVPGTSLATPGFSRAVNAGASVHAPVQDAFWGVRTGEVLDPSGHRWAFDQHLRDVPVQEIEAQLAGMLAGPS
jgi:PhnB protein